MAEPVKNAYFSAESTDFNEFSEDVPLRIKEENEPADFETAISATGFGKFNIVVILAAILPGWASVFASISLAYVMPIAQCDLELTLNQKGYLMSIPYLGMIISGAFWGFLSDTYGRKRIIVTGLFMNAFFSFMSGLSQNFGMIMFTKFMAGLVVNGPFTATASQLSEYLSAKYRARILLYMGISYCCSFIALPFIGMLVLSQNINFNLLFLKLHSWNLFLLICAMPALIGGICQIFIPESPKYLMTAGRNDKALKIFQKVYEINTGKPVNSFPIKKLLEEKVQENKSLSRLEAFKNGCANQKPLFRYPLLPRVILVCIIEMCVLLSMNTMKFWLPQIFTAINDYKSMHNNEDASICLMLETLGPNKTTTTKEKVGECIVNYNNSSVYTNAMIVSFSMIIGYIFIGTLINVLGKKKVFLSLGTLATISAISLYFSQNVITVIALSSIFATVIGLSNNVLITITIDSFPTTLRTTAISTSMMMGRAGAMIGNLVMPYLFTAGCLPPFLFISLASLLFTILGIFLPNTDMKALE